MLIKPSALLAQPQNKFANYFRERHIFENTDCLCDAAFFLSVAEVGLGYSTYLRNCLEALWASFDSQHSTEARMYIKDLFVALGRDSRAWEADDHFRKIHVKPHGNNLKVPALMRGLGMLATKGGLYDEQFRRPTLAQMLEASSAGHSVFLPKGSHDHWRWTEARVYSKRNDFIA